MTHMNHETFHGNRSALFSEIRNTDTQMDRRAVIHLKMLELMTSLEVAWREAAAAAADVDSRA